MRRAFAAFVLGLAVLAVQAQSPPKAAAPSGETLYTIAINRPRGPGETYKLDTTLVAHTVGHMGLPGATGGQVGNAKLTMKGSLRVLRVNAIGEPVMFLLTVDKASLLNDKKDVPLDLDGAQIGATYPDGKPHFVRRDGKKLGPEASQLLAMMFPMPKGVSPDTYEGPGHPVKPGDSWPVNAGAIARLFKTPGKEAADASKISGTVSFKGIEEWEGLPCYHLAAKASFKNITMPHFLGSMSMNMEQDILQPTDTKINKMRQVTTIVNDVFGKFMSENGPVADIKTKSTVTVTTVVH